MSDSQPARVAQPVERVAAVPRADAAALGLLPHGFAPLPAPDLLDRLCRSLRFLERPSAEEDPSHKQLIPYGVVTRGDRVLLLERLSGGGEARLHGKLSIGVGGHINPPDIADDPGGAELDPRSVLELGMRRELDEELVVEGAVALRPVGIINDDTTAVGSVHLGVLFHVTLAEAGAAAVREVDTLRGSFVAWSEVAARRERLETWSSFALDAFAGSSRG